MIATERETDHAQLAARRGGPPLHETDEDEIEARRWPAYEAAHSFDILLDGRIGWHEFARNSRDDSVEGVS